MVLASSRFSVPVSVEYYNLPSTVDDIISVIKNIIESGSIHGLTLILDNPIVVYRARPEEFEIESLIESTLSAVDIFEYLADEKHSPSDRIIGMCKVLAKDKLNPVCFVTGKDKTGLLDKWFQIEESGLPKKVDSLIGLPIIRLDSLDEKTLVLCGSTAQLADVEDITIAIKTEIETESHDASRVNKTSDEAIDRVGIDPKEYCITNDSMEITSARIGDIDWDPTNIIRKW